MHQTYLLTSEGDNCPTNGFAAIAGGMRFFASLRMTIESAISVILSEAKNLIPRQDVPQAICGTPR